MSGGDIMFFFFIFIVLVLTYVFYLKKRKQRRGDVAHPGSDGRINIVGLPNSGKTIYFCVCMDLLQNWFNRFDDSRSITYESPRTNRMITDVISDLRDNRSWASNTQENTRHIVSIMYDNKIREIYFMDYSGESFLQMYKDVKQEPAEGVSDADSAKTSDTADGDIIFIIDSTSLREKKKQELSDCLFNFFKELEELKFHGKLAVVVTQGDRIRDIGNESIEELFKEQQSNSYARLKKLRGKLRCEYKFFLVTAVDCEIDEKGNYIPPLGYSPKDHSKDVCAPLLWLMGIDIDDEKIKQTE